VPSNDIIVKNRSFQSEEIVHSHLTCFVMSNKLLMTTKLCIADEGIQLRAINIALNILVTAGNTFT